jgi:hypothetical protein
VEPDGGHARHAARAAWDLVTAQGVALELRVHQAAVLYVELMRVHVATFSLAAAPSVRPRDDLFAPH